LFEQMKNMDNGKERQEIIDRMMDILRKDAPWLWGFHPKQFSLNHSWYTNIKPNLMANNTLKYRRLDPETRVMKQAKWNQPVILPLVIAFALLVISIIPAMIGYRRRQRMPACPVQN
jgi:oligopeptide transport system substrate-binding protein